MSVSNAQAVALEIGKEKQSRAEVLARRDHAEREAMVAKEAEWNGKLAVYRKLVERDAWAPSATLHRQDPSFELSRVATELGVHSSWVLQDLSLWAKVAAHQAEQRAINAQRAAWREERLEREARKDLRDPAIIDADIAAEKARIQTELLAILDKTLAPLRKLLIEKAKAATVCERDETEVDVSGSVLEQRFAPLWSPAFRGFWKMPVRTSVNRLANIYTD